PHSEGDWSRAGTGHPSRPRVFTGCGHRSTLRTTRSRLPIQGSSRSLRPSAGSGASGGFAVMGKKRKSKTTAGHKPADDMTEATDAPVMKRREFAELVKPLHAELVAVQEWTKST